MGELPTIGLTLNYRDAARTEQCVRSLQAEGVANVLVWDNSADGGASATALSAALSGNAGVRVLVSDDNLGFATGVNRGLAEVAVQFPGSLALLINNDAHLVPGALALLGAALARQPEAWVAYPDVNHGGWVRGTVYYQRFTGLISDYRLPGAFAYPSGCCLLINLPLTGPQLFDTDFFMYGEDVALGARLSHLPGAMVHVPLDLVVHEGSASSGMGTLFYESRTIAAHLILVRKLASTRPQQIALLFGRACVLPLRAAWRSLRYRTLMPLLAAGEAWRLARSVGTASAGASEQRPNGRQPRSGCNK